ncbi:MAG: DUF2065 domain-containing protein [Pseudomonadota bacterium]
MTDLIVALGLVLIIEGLLYAAAPGLVRRMAMEVPHIAEQSLRLGGVIAIAIGVFVVWLVRG